MARVHGTAADGEAWHAALKGGRRKSPLGLPPMGEAVEEEPSSLESPERRDSNAPPVFCGAHHVTGLFGMQWCRATGLIATGCKDGSVGL